MPSGKADWTVEIVDAAGNADHTVAVVGDQVVDLTGAAPGDVLTVQPGGTVAPETVILPPSIQSARPAADTVPVGAIHFSTDTAALVRSDGANWAAYSGAFVPNTLFDANTVLAADTDNTPAAVAAGASTVLARLAAGNIKFASVAEILTLLGVAPYGLGIPGAAVNDWVSPWGVIDGSPAVFAINGRMLFTPLWVPNGFTAISKLGLSVGGGTVGSVVRLGLYSMTATGRPGTCLKDVTVDGTIAWGFQEPTAAVSGLTPNSWVFAATVAQGTPGTQPSVQVMVDTLLPNIGPSWMSGGGCRSWYQDGVTGALPATATPLYDTAGSPPAVSMKLA